MSQTEIQDLPAAKPRIRKLWYVLVGVVILLAIGGALLGAMGPHVRVAVATRRNLEQHVVSSGRVRVPTRVQVSTQIPGLIVAVGAVEGQHVHTGDLLLRLDDAEALVAVAQARAAVAQAQARVDQLKRVGAIVTTEALKQAKTNLERAETELARIKNLVASGGVPQNQLEEAIRAVDIARAQQAVAAAQQVSAAPMGADSRISLTALLTAQAQLDGANVRLAQTRVSALHDGVVLNRSVEPGDVVQPAKTLLVVAADADTELVFQADERNVGVIALGQKARASADAYPQQEFDAVVDYIAPSIDPQRGSVEVRLSVLNPPSVLKPEMTVSIDLTVAAVAMALGVPAEGVHGLLTPNPWVEAVAAGHVLRREVKVGLHGEGTIEILEGLEEGDAVVIPDGRVLKVGQRVRPEVVDAF